MRQPTDPRAAQLLSKLLALCERKVTLDSVELDTPLADLGITSLQSMELVLELQELYGIELSDDELGALETVGDVLMVLADKPAQPS
jgi:acyl carrier protein